ncbi:hypothetical protein BaRGS_00032569 [Batillaria attramentaria]|uniref:Sialate O-acetylesterase domain-containing protein n=1 Tax=Batillaria attramentaria TaxID=370345 RepID=A0ABD0JNH2_9CAEN
MLSLVRLLAALAIFAGNVHCALKLASEFHSHMVLQRGPQHAVLWGTASTEGDTVTAKVTGQGSHIAPVTTQVTNGHWKLKLHAVTQKGPFVITVSSSEGDVTLNDVLFGDVWLCSGQSNMHFLFNGVMNATAEIQNALQYHDVRFTRAKLASTDTPQTDMVFDVPWTGPTTQRLAQSSAVCWLFGQYLYDHLHYPIGLVESSYGGTNIEAWSPPEALHDCSATTKRGPQEDSVLWNAMINPLRSMTMYGAIWYQGESNSGHYAKYSCQIQALVNRWREQFNQQSLNETDREFPFGYVQLAGFTHDDKIGVFPPFRMAQTANYGYSPNPALPNTFMAVAMDLPDFDSPYGVNEAQHKLTIEYDHGHTPIEIRSQDGFEVCCSATSTTTCTERHDQWVAAPITGHNAGHVTVSYAGCGTRHLVGMRYEWKTSPCEYKMCTVYASDTQLPAPTYITHTLPQ